MGDPYNLRRFVNAQQQVFERVCGELRQGQKQSHWMWFIFPQIKGLGHSEMAQRFAISSRQEAEAYLAHPILGPRLRESSQIVADLQDRPLVNIFGYPDDMKVRSSMTLFAQVAAAGKEIFKQCLENISGGNPIPQRLLP